MRAALIAGLALAVYAAAANACGICIEDKIAAVYDHAVVTRALGRKHQVVFFAIDGPLVAGKASHQMIERAAEATFGVDPSTTRVSVELASLCVSFDPNRTSFATLQHALGRKLAPRGITLLPLRVMDRTMDLKTVDRP